MNRIKSHPILGDLESRRKLKIYVDGQTVEAYEGEMIAAALMASGRSYFRQTHKYHEPRGIFCGIGRCTDCMMTVNGIPNVRTCITRVEEGMQIQTQVGCGSWEEID